MASPSRRIGILGGTFDPIHRGHTDVAEAAQQHLALQSVYFIPANIPPHRPQAVASSFHRFAMAAFAIADHASWRMSDIELRAERMSYTSETLRRFHHDGFAPGELFFITGADAFAEIAMWRDYPSILDLTHFVVVSRPGHPVSDMRRTLPDLSSRMIGPSDKYSSQATSIILIDAQTADVSSTAIRRLIANGESIAGLVAPNVEQYIDQHGLYRSSGSAAGDMNHSLDSAAGRLHG
jgi:nicotinate-nucleotide adenylyltransferase